ncbi:rho GTPase-activating 22 isoform X3 [Pelobates cultripes]|uniref:Rho GTPase-activating 22 isoform X3 n=1 Tax=Pelobates cultripes TaxID=61616 RepID=A0AAD1WQ61_PELCU|nr:rho GTPase-activating 22 isoform X3 [Pelobates cultripes]
MGLCCCRDREHLSSALGDKVAVNHEAFLLMANSQNEMEDWVRAIRRVIWAPFGGAVFGQSLEDAVNMEGSLAPLVVEQCVDFIREHGLQEEGLFRLPGQATLVRDLQETFDCGGKPQFDVNTDVHTVASLLKLYLRELPEPVIPFSRYQDFLACAHILSRDQEEGTEELCRLVSSLPAANYNLLKYICSFLDEVQSHSGVNKMSVHNLATVFAPNILRPKLQEPLALIEGASLIQHLMTVLISENQQVFPVIKSDAAVCTTGQQICSAEWLPSGCPAECKQSLDLPRTVEPIVNGSREQTPAKNQMWLNWKSSFRSSTTKQGSSSSEIPNLPSSGAWLLNGLSSLRGHRRTSSGERDSVQRLSTYDNVPSCPPSLHNSTWSSSCNVSVTDSLGSCSVCRSQVSQGSETGWQDSPSQSQRGTICLVDSTERLEMCVSSSEHSDALTSGSVEAWDTCHRMVTEMKTELSKQRQEYESRIQSLERSRAELRLQFSSLQEALEQEKKRCTLLEIKLRNSERGREDAENRNTLLQKEMEEFFQTLGNLSQQKSPNHT